jgi:hypothetical protein
VIDDDDYDVELQAPVSAAPESDPFGCPELSRHVAEGQVPAARFLREVAWRQALQSELCEILSERGARSIEAVRETRAALAAERDELIQLREEVVSLRAAAGMLRAKIQRLRAISEAPDLAAQLFELAERQGTQATLTAARLLIAQALESRSSARLAAAAIGLTPKGLNNRAVRAGIPVAVFGRQVSA